MAVRPKVFEFSGGIDESGRLVAENGAAPIATGPGWTPEHLVLAAVARCSLGSLRHYAHRAGIAVEGSGRARGTVTARPEDGRYALVEVTVDLDVRLDPPPEEEAVRKLLARAESGCFVGSSLRATPVYRWRVNGREMTAAA